MGRRKRASKSGQDETPAKTPADLRDRPLFFAHLNGQWPETAEAICGLVRAEFAFRCRGPEWKRRLVAVLEEHAGPELLARVEGMEVRKGELRLEVAEPAVRYELGLRWEQRLLTLLRTQLPAAGITAVRFVSAR